LVVSDGAPGIIRVLEECFPRALRERCLAHKMRNLASKLPEDRWPEFKARAVGCYQAASPALARLLRDDIRTTAGAICRARWPASRMISRPASRICVSLSATAGRFAPPTCWNGCLARNGGAPR